MKIYYLSLFAIFNAIRFEVKSCGRNWSTSDTKQACECAVNETIVTESFCLIHVCQMTSGYKWYWLNSIFKGKCEVLGTVFCIGFTNCLWETKKTEREQCKLRRRYISKEWMNKTTKTIFNDEIQTLRLNLTKSTDTTIFQMLIKLGKTFNASITESKHEMAYSINSSITKAKHDLEQRVQEIINSSFEDTKITVSEKISNISETLETISKSLSEQMKSLFSVKIRSLEENSAKRDKEMKYLMTECINKLNIVIYIMVLLIPAVLWLLWMNIHFRRTGNISGTTIQTRRERTERGPDYRLKWSQSLEEAICVITFHTDTEQTHVHTTSSVFKSGGQKLPRILSQVVLQHSDISDLPGCLVYLVYVDFNDRNVILEDPDKGLGSLRLTTVRSLLQFGGDVTVIYCGDSSSRLLTCDLYSRHLTSVNSQPELKMLRSKGRILSIDRDFSEHQKQHCQGYINSVLEITL